MPTNTRRSAPTPPIDLRRPARYEIRLQGHLSAQWDGWFQSLDIAREDSGETRLTGMIVDQAALYGLLRKIRDLGMPLIAVMYLGPAQGETGETP